MRQKRYLLLILICCLLLTLTCCKGRNFKEDKNYPNSDYYISGIYLGFMKVEEPSIKDINPKTYLDYKDNYMFCCTSGTTDYRIVFDDRSRNVNEVNEIMEITLYATLNVPTLCIEDLGKNLNLYLIKQDRNGEYTIDKTNKALVELKDTTSYSYKTTFSYDNKKYAYSISLNIIVK